MLFRIFTVLAVLALGVSIWILSEPERAPRTPVNAPATDTPGYYLKQAVLTDYDTSGSPSLRITAEKIDQIAHGNEVALRQVRIDYNSLSTTSAGAKSAEATSLGATSWVMTGDAAHVQLGGNVVDVSGNVRLQGRTVDRADEALIRTDSLSYNVADSIASTASDVRIEFAHQLLTAHGLVANLKARTVRLESRVNGRFQP